jgi:hypothetical protein
VVACIQLAAAALLRSCSLPLAAAARYSELDASKIAHARQALLAKGWRAQHEEASREAEWDERSPRGTTGTRLVCTCAQARCACQGRTLELRSKKYFLLALLELSARLKGSRCWMDTTNRMSSGLMKDTSETRSNNLDRKDEEVAQP